MGVVLLLSFNCKDSVKFKEEDTSNAPNFSEPHIYTVMLGQIVLSNQISSASIVVIIKQYSIDPYMCSWYANHITYT